MRAMIPTSPRLSYKLISMDDLATFSKLAQDHHVREFLMEGFELSTEECQDLISAGLELHNQHGLGIYLISNQNEIIGYCGFMHTNPRSQDLDVVYAFLKDHTGKGYATEACKALTKLAKDLNFPGEITAVVNPENKPSIKVLEKCGFVNQGFCEGDLNHLIKYRFDSRLETP